MRKLFGVVGLLGVIAWMVAFGLVLWSSPKLLSTTPTLIVGAGSFWVIMVLLYIARWPKLSRSSKGYLAVTLLLLALGPTLMFVFGGLIGFIGIMLLIIAVVMLVLKVFMGREGEKTS